MPNQVTLVTFIVFALDQISFSMRAFGADCFISLLTIAAAIIATTLAVTRAADRPFPSDPLATVSKHMVAACIGALLVAASATLGLWPVAVTLALSTFFGFGLVVFG